MRQTKFGGKPEMVVTQAAEFSTEIERVRRIARQIDGVSQDLLNRYLREVEYDLVYRADERDRRVSI